MLITLVVLLSGIPFFLLLAPGSPRLSARRAVMSNEAQPEPAAPVLSQPLESGTYAFELPQQSEARRNG